jgi:HK97 gp10 family phage protein
MAKVVWHGNTVMAEIATKSDTIINAAALEVRTEAQNSMRPPKSGRIYRVPGFSRTYQASAPGEAPAIRTGNLRSSILVEFVGPCYRRVGTNVEYAKYLEFGTRRISARPFLRPALEKVAAKYRAKVKL